MTRPVAVTDRTGLSQALRTLKLSGMLATLDARLTQAAARHQITILAPPGTGRAVPATRPRWRSRGARARCGTG